MLYLVLTELGAIMKLGVLRL